MGLREIAAGSLPAYSLGGYIAAWRRARWTTKTGHGFLVWTFTVKGSTISTRSIGAKDVEPRSLLAGLARRSRLNLTDSALKSSPLLNLTPRRSLISQTVGATSFGISTASAGTILRSGPRSTSDSKICAPTLEAGCSCWCIMSSVVGSTPCAITTRPSGAAAATTGPSATPISTTAIRHCLMGDSSVGSGLLGQRAAVDDQLAAGHVGGVVGGEVEHRAHDLGDGAHPAQGHALEALLHGVAVAEGAVEHLGVDRARVDRVAADLVLGVLGRGHLGEEPDGALARRVGGLLVQRLADAGHRGDVDDRAAARAAHGRDRVLGAEEDALGVDRHHLVPLRDGALLDRHLGDHDGRVVDQDVEPPVAIERGLHRRSPVRLAGHVQVEVDGVAPRRPDARLDVLPLFVPDVAEDDLRALAREGLRLRRALPSSPAADQRDLPVQFAHSVLPGQPSSPIGIA